MRSVWGGARHVHEQTTKDLRWLYSYDARARVGLVGPDSAVSTLAAALCDCAVACGARAYIYCGLISLWRNATAHRDGATGQGSVSKCVGHAWDA